VIRKKLLAPGEVVSEVRPRILVALATYNERDNLEALLSGIHAHLPAAEVLVIDDASPDGTGELADELARRDGWLHILHRQGKLGLGTALLAAMRRALEEHFDLLVTMDADFSHHPRYLPALVAGTRDRDVMIGSRYVRGGAHIGWPASRALISRGVNLLCRLLLRLPARDCSGGYRCYRVEMLGRARLDRLISRGYSFEEEVLYRCRQAGARIGETPIVFENRREGSSKVNLREAARSLAVLLGLGIQSFFGLE
jgi:dolichol-phosphate mannosyltransferase